MELRDNFGVEGILKPMYERSLQGSWQKHATEKPCVHLEIIDTNVSFLLITFSTNFLRCTNT